MSLSRDDKVIAWILALGGVTVMILLVLCAFAYAHEVQWFEAGSGIVEQVPNK